MNKSLEDVLKERQRQNDKWGEQNHDLFIWNAILTEEVGEFSQAILHDKFGGGKNNVREEAIHCAAVALQIIEFIDRNKQECWLCNHANGTPQTYPCNCNEKCYCKVEGMCKKE